MCKRTEAVLSDVEREMGNGIVETLGRVSVLSVCFFGETNEITATNYKDRRHGLI